MVIALFVGIYSQKWDYATGLIATGIGFLLTKDIDKGDSNENRSKKDSKET